MENKLKHKVVRCDVRGCKDEAKYWIPTDKLSGDFDVKSETFYLCDNHNYLLESQEQEGYICFLNPETGRIREIEVGVYSCHEECGVCN
jgi:hypothetical protein